MTEQQQLRIMRNCEALVLWMDPSALLEDDQELLEMDFEDLGAGPAGDPQVGMEQTKIEVPVDTEGSIRFRRQRRRNRDTLGADSCSITRTAHWMR